MNPSDIPRWLDEHGGADGPPQTDANGVTTHRARDGSYVTVYNGQVRMIGHGAPVGVPVNTEPTAAPAAGRGSGAMNQAELDAYVAAQAPGGDVNNWEFNRGTKTKEIQSAAGTRTVQVPFVQWIDRKTGRTLEYEVQPGGGSYTEVFNGVKPENKKDMQNTPGAAKEGDVRGGGKDQKKRERFVNGQWVVEDNPLYEPETPKPQNVPTNTSEPFIATRMPDGTLTWERNQNYKGPEPKPGSVLQIKGPNGKTYLVPVDAQGNPGQARDSGVPGDAPTEPGPRLPQIILGNSQEALRTYHEQLSAGVASGRWSQAWANERWAEAHQVAQIAVQEAATRQRNEESSRNAEFNIANARMGSMNTATSNALTFVNSINGLLPAGSNLGGQAFAALLGLNMLQSQMSGMNRIDPRRQPPQLTPAEIANPAALQARREQVQTQVQQAAAPPVRDDWNRPAQPQAPSPAPAPAPAPTPAPQPLSPGQAGMMSPVPDAENPPVAPQAPIEPAPPALGSAPAPAPAEAPPAAPPMTESGQRVAEQGTVILRHRLTGETRVMTRYQWEQEQARAGLLGRAANALWEEVGGAAPDRTVPPIQGPLVEEQAPAPEPQPSGGAFPPLPVVPRAGSEAGGNVQKVMPNPAGEWAALAPLAPMPMQQPAMAGMAQMGEPLAARRARIASTPPWRLSEDDLLWSEQNGFGQEAWGVPGRVA